MPSSFIVLYDFSPYARQALLVAHQWSAWIGAELHLLHNIDESYVPAMADQEARQEVHSLSRSEVFDKLTQQHLEETGEAIPPDKVHVSTKSLFTSLAQITRELDVQLVFSGLKGKSLLKRFLAGSTVLKLLDYVEVPVVSVPKRLPLYTQLALHVSVSYHYTFNSIALQQFLDLMGDNIKELVFLTVCTENDNREKAAALLDKLQTIFSDHPSVSTHLFEGDTPLAQVKAHMLAQTDGVLVVQKGSRALSDHLFRKFFVDELVHDASLPMLILPT